MEKNTLIKLIDKYLEGQATPDEEKLLTALFDSFQDGSPANPKLAELEDPIYQRIHLAISKKDPK